MSGEAPTCSECGEPVSPGQGIPCHLCGALFHFSPERLCGAVLPQVAAC